MKPITVTRGIAPKPCGGKARVYVVGDIQGCYDELRYALDAVAFDAQHDVLWCVGDLVNRGSESAKVLRYLKELGDACVAVLGNHDLHLLQMTADSNVRYPKDNCQEVLNEPDAEELLHWLRCRPLLHHDAERKWCMVHAGLHPNWSLNEAKLRAAEVEQVLQSDDWQTFCAHVHAKEFPKKDDAKHTLDRMLFTTAMLTRARQCSASLSFDWKYRSGAGHKGDRAWFRFASPQSWRKDCRVVYGHWAAKGLVLNKPHVLGLDSGCVWGGSLTIAHIQRSRVRILEVPAKAYQRMDEG